VQIFKSITAREIFAAMKTLSQEGTSGMVSSGLRVTMWPLSEKGLTGEQSKICSETRITKAISQTSTAFGS
jgi:hypothetical protein